VSCRAHRCMSLKNTQGSSSCTACPANSISTAGSVDITDCKCNPGHTGADGGNCTACPQSTYKPLRGSGACTECSTTHPNTAHALTGQVNSTGCVCDAGYRLTTGACESCPEGTYKIPLVDSLCLPCSGNSTSKPASTNPSACVCNEGYVLRYGPLPSLPALATPEVQIHMSSRRTGTGILVLHSTVDSLFFNDVPTNPGPRSFCARPVRRCRWRRS
jgi:hypothetical protein